MGSIKLILAIDPGTKCGFALRDESGVLASGTWDLAPSRYESAGMRWIKLESCLSKMLPRNLGRTIDMVAYEEVRGHKGVDAAHIYGGIVAHIQRWCDMNAIPYMGIPVATVKKAATGKGNANKDQMIEAARKRWGEHLAGDDNEYDARWIAECAWSEHGDAEHAKR